MSTCMGRLGRLSIAACLVAAAGCTSLGRNESVLFQPCVCYPLAESGQWGMAVRGGVYRLSWLDRLEPEIIHWIEAHKLVSGTAEAMIFERRLKPFLADHPAGKVVDLPVGDRVIPLPASDKSGRILGEVVLTEKEVSKLESAAPGRTPWITFRIRAAKGDPRGFILRAQVLHRRGITVVSDIDDTIKITDVNNTKLMLKNTFMLAYRPVPGMPEVYAGWAARGAAFHYLSESPLELCEPLSELISSAGYPEGSIDLREIAWKPSRIKGFLGLVDAPPDFKLTELKRLIEAMPERDYVLVGDSSQHDPEVYGETARRYPDRIRRILIRDVTCQSADDPRYQAAFRALPRELWQIFRDPAEIRDAIPAKRD